MQFRDQSSKPLNKPLSRKSIHATASANSSVKNSVPTSRHWTPTQVQKELETLVKASALSATLSVYGELINFSARSNTGHMYFDIIDEQKNKLSCTLFCVDRVVPTNTQDKLANGVQVVVHGKIRCVSKFKGSQYQLNVRKLQMSNDDSGLHEKQMQEWKTMLRDEGVFDIDHKRAIPRYIEHLAVLTSAEGAVINDIRQTLTNANVPVKLTVFDCAVQGESCVGSILKNLRNICEESTNTYEAVLITRGGGSREDLSAFNHPLLLRGIDAMRGVGTLPPVLCAIGHQTDQPLLDDVCDETYITPTYAAQCIAQPFVDARRSVERVYDATRVRLAYMLNTMHSTFDKLLHTIQHTRPQPHIQASLQSTYHNIQMNLTRHISKKHFEYTRLRDNTLQCNPLSEYKQKREECYDVLHGKLTCVIQNRNTHWDELFNSVQNVHPWSVFAHHNNCVILQDDQTNKDLGVLDIIKKRKGTLTILSAQGQVCIEYNAKETN